jgi:hypothetical protein
MDGPAAMLSSLPPVGLGAMPQVAQPPEVSSFDVRAMAAHYERENTDLREHVRGLRQVLAHKEGEAAQYNHLLELHFQESESLRFQLAASMQQLNALLTAGPGTTADHHACAAPGMSAASPGHGPIGSPVASRTVLNLQQCVSTAGGASFSSGPLPPLPGQASLLGPGPSGQGPPLMPPPPGPPGSPNVATQVMGQGSPLLSWQPGSPSQAPLSHPATPGAKPPTWAPPSHPAPALAAHGVLQHDLGIVDPPARDAMLLPPAAAPGLGAAPVTLRSSGGVRSADPNGGGAAR